VRELVVQRTPSERMRLLKPWSAASAPVCGRVQIPASCSGSSQCGDDSQRPRIGKCHSQVVVSRATGSPGYRRAAQGGCQRRNPTLVKYAEAVPYLRKPAVGFRSATSWSRRKETGDGVSNRVRIGGF